MQLIATIQVVYTSRILWLNYFNFPPNLPWKLRNQRSLHSDSPPFNSLSLLSSPCASGARPSHWIAFWRAGSLAPEFSPLSQKLLLQWQNSSTQPSKWDLRTSLAHWQQHWMPYSCQWRQEAQHCAAKRFSDVLIDYSALSASCASSSSHSNRECLRG